MVKIRLQRRGRRKKPFYHIVIADARAPRDGRFIEKIGTYNPMTKPATIDLDRDLAFDWLLKGAQPTDTVRAILRVNGVMYRKHLHRGVVKGALTQEEADAKLADWVSKKDASHAERTAETRREQEAERRKVAGVRPKIEVPEPEPEPTPEPAAEAAPAADATEAAEANTAEGVEAIKTADESVTQEPPAEDVPAAAPTEEVVEAVVEEAASPEAENAVAAGDAAEPDIHSAVDKAANAAKEAPEPEEVAAEASAPKAEEAAPAEADDLTKIEGIGPKISEALTKGGIPTYAALAAKSPEEVKAILDEADGNFNRHTPTTWPQQAQLAADGKWDELKSLQDQLDGGKPVAESTEA